MVACTETSCGHAGMFGKLWAHIITCNHDTEIKNMNWHETRNTQSPLSVTCSRKNPPSEDSTTSPKQHHELEKKHADPWTNVSKLSFTPFLSSPLISFPPSPCPLFISPSCTAPLPSFLFKKVKFARNWME